MSPTTARKTQASRPDVAYKEIRRRILESELVPGDPLSEVALAEELQVSRTPVRQALQRLAQAGLVATQSNRGSFVKAISAEDIVQIYEIREQLEGYAAGVASRNLSAKSIAELRDGIVRARMQVKQGKTRAAFDSDILLHAAIVGSTRNTRLRDILATLQDQVHRIRLSSGEDTERLRFAVEEHEAIIDAIGRRDAKAARSAMKKHLRSARDHALGIRIK
jgi:DNA-binding GntR family transcriptional regulator